MENQTMIETSVYQKLEQFVNRYSKTINTIIQMLLIALFMYAAMTKLFDYREARHQMLNQVFPKQVAILFIWLVPLAEILICLLINIKKTRLLGLYCYLIIMCSFTVYIILVMNNLFGRIPCSCGGAIDTLKWSEHLLLNLTFILLAILSIILTKRERRLKN